MSLSCRTLSALAAPSAGKLSRGDRAARNVRVQGGVRCVRSQLNGEGSSAARPVAPAASLITSQSWDSLSRASAAPQTMQRPPDMDPMALLLKQRIVFLGSEMNDFVADAIVSQLLLLDAQDAEKEIRLFINCPGGSISASMAIYDAIQLCRAPVSTIAFGLAASTAAVVLAGGTKGLRLSMPNARIMMHQPLGGASGQAIDVEIQAKEIMHHKDNIARILAEKTGRAFEQVLKDIDRDRYMSPMEAVEYGAIDGVIDKDAIIPLKPLPERVKPRSEFLAASDDPRRFLIPNVPDDEIF